MRVGWVTACVLGMDGLEVGCFRYVKFMTHLL